MTTITDVEQALTNARVLEEYWMSNGWESLEFEEDTIILDIYATVQSVSPTSDPEVRVTIELEKRMYQVPLEDVSSIHINDSLVIEKEHLYPDWLSRILAKVGEDIDINHHIQVVDSKGRVWDRLTYLNSDAKVRIVWELIE